MANTIPCLLIEHPYLQAKHPAVGREVETKDKLERDGISQARNIRTPRSSSNKQTASNALMKKFLGENDCPEQPLRSKEKEEQSLKATALWIAGSSLPLSMVDDPAYEEVLKSYDKKVNNPTIPCSKLLRFMLKQYLSHYNI